MLDVADDVVVVAELGEDFVAARKSAARREVEAQLLFQPAQRIVFPARIGCQPDIRHAAAVEQFAQVEPAEFLRSDLCIRCDATRQQKSLAQELYSSEIKNVHCRKPFQRHAAPVASLSRAD